jgi:hypothetical protein
MARRSASVAFGRFLSVPTVLRHVGSDDQSSSGAHPGMLATAPTALE